MAECDICMAKKSKWSCLCTASFCQDCMSIYNKPDCSACQKVWSLDDPIRTKLKKIVKAHEIEKLKLREMKALSSAQVYVDWIIEVEAIQKNLRFGISKAMPKKPKLVFEVQEGESFPCPKEDCRGFVSAKLSQIPNSTMSMEDIQTFYKSACGTCKDSVCLRCRELSPSNHKCDEKTVQNIAELRNTCKMCPRCNAQIYKTAGCDHMFCTHCRGHFHWKTNQPLKNNASTNGHYNDTSVYAKNIQVNSSDPDWLKKENKQTSTSLCERQRDDLTMNPGSDTCLIFQNEFSKKLWKKVFVDDLTCLRQLYKQKYSSWFQKQMDTLIDLRCKQLRKIFDETTFYDKIYSLEETNQKMTFEKDILETVLHVACDLFYHAIQLQTTFADPFLHQFIDFLGILSQTSTGKLLVFLPTLVDPLPFVRL